MAWNKSVGRSPAVKPPRKPVWGILISVLVAVAVFLLIHLPSSSPSADISPAKEVRQIKTLPTVPLRQPTVSAMPVTTSNMTDEVWKDSFITNLEKRIKFSVLAEARTNEQGVIVERYRLPNGRYWRITRDPPPLFSNPCDNVIATILAGRAGEQIPPVPGLDDANLDQEFLNSLTTPIKIKPDDRPHIAALKLAVKAARSDIAEMIKNGDKRSVGTILKDYLNENNRNAEIKGDAVMAWERVRREMGDEAAGEYLGLVNEKLEKMGISPIKGTKTARRHND